LVEKHKGEIAGAIFTPYHHPVYADQEMPKEGFWKTIEEICKKENIVLILDDIRAGFRLHISGSNEYFGFKPDLITFCKAMANGHPISACCGKEKFKEAASRIFFTGTFYFSRTPMAAAIATLEELKAIDGINYMFKIGKMLQDGLKKLAENHNLEVSVTGPPPIPFM
ncbi:glutamate-1-semialdehyde 2,1-aminomutase, partial [Candidatus Hakubella thermalkaliphila]